MFFHMCTECIPGKNSAWKKFSCAAPVTMFKCIHCWTNVPPYQYGACILHPNHFLFLNWKKISLSQKIFHRYTVRQSTHREKSRLLPLWNVLRRRQQWVLNLLDFFFFKCTAVRHHQATLSLGWNRERTLCKESGGETVFPRLISLLGTKG